MQRRKRTVIGIATHPVRAPVLDLHELRIYAAKNAISVPVAMGRAIRLLLAQEAQPTKQKP